jgi:hypothetical protein
VRGDPVQHQLAFPEGFADQAELQLFEVAEAAVEQLAGPARRAGGQVSGLDERDPQAPRRGVQRGPDPDHAAADDDDVEGLGLQASPGLLAFQRPHATGDGRLDLGLGLLVHRCCPGLARGHDKRLPALTCC